MQPKSSYLEYIENAQNSTLKKKQLENGQKKHFTKWQINMKRCSSSLAIWKCKFKTLSEELDDKSQTEGKYFQKTHLLKDCGTKYAMNSSILTLRK